MYAEGDYEHENASVRLAAHFVRDAYRAFERDDVHGALIAIRSAAMFEEGIAHRADTGGRS